MERSIKVPGGCRLDHQLPQTLIIVLTAAALYV